MNKSLWNAYWDAIFASQKFFMNILLPPWWIEEDNKKKKDEMQENGQTMVDNVEHFPTPNRRFPVRKFPVRK